MILALPTILAGWLVSRFDAPGLRTVTPTLVLEFAGLVFTSLLTVGITVGKLSYDKTHRTTSDAFPGILADTFSGHPAWTAVWVLSVAMSFLTVFGFATRYWRYKLTLRKDH